MSARLTALHPTAHAASLTPAIDLEWSWFVRETVILALHLAGKLGASGAMGSALERGWQACEVGSRPRHVVG